ncbi:restriction endonuclease [Gordonia amicalis]|uniref:restriction endonuclease n=1 Tax=Gordonia amicalis TaxID=89053 RepID=UPI001268D42C|nr:restriction endonuclease [Gordonia amicalis]
MISIPAGVPDLYDPDFVADFALAGEDPRSLYGRLLLANPEAETFVACAAAIHKARLKYQRVLSSQPLASMDQVAPRGLLQYGQLDPHPLTALLVWRKWLYDLDNRAAQDTGYLFEPVIAGAIGGVPYSAAKSPVRRATGKGGRQVDCLKGAHAYEIKLRITIAASGQGRWSEELQFPSECKGSGLVPVLVVLDPTPNVKLSELIKSFRDSGGEVYIGDDAWGHLKAEAGPAMAIFLEKYIRQPLDEITLSLDEGDPLPAFSVIDRGVDIEMVVGAASMIISRDSVVDINESSDLIPDDGGDFLPGI